MESTCISQTVRLVTQLPDHGLEAGAVGVVCSVWCRPLNMLEVEFERPDSHEVVRALVTPHDIEVFENADDTLLASA